MPIATHSNGAKPIATAVEAVENPPLLSQYELAYDPSLTLNHPEFKKLADDAPELQDPNANLACCYNPAHEVNMVNKPVPKARVGECIVHVRATGICGYVHIIYDLLKTNIFCMVPVLIMGIDPMCISGNTVRLVLP